MLKAGREKDPENILREEMLKERAEVLGRADCPTLGVQLLESVELPLYGTEQAALVLCQ